MGIPNSLIHSRSLYLRQHAFNPVQWLPWQQSSLMRAQEEQKLIIVSIGYSACHWCHVMEHECFENKEVAEYMNQHFVCIKVDREEHPDVDAVYMEAVQLMQGSGGWPLNCICLPNGKPIYGGTYFPKNHWLSVLREIVLFVSKQPQDAFEYAQKITNQIQQIETEHLIVSDLSVSLPEDIFQKWEKQLDFRYGGNSQAPKFPMPNNWLYLLRYGVLSHNAKAIEIVKRTLDSLLSGGIYDHLGGGFSRYSTDSRWFSPHFEKMLYDNAQLISLYAEAYRYFKNPDYQEVVEKTIAFALRELKQEKGFSAAIDADSENQEGQFYVWKYAEIQDVLGELALVACKYYGCTVAGNWEPDKNILAPSFSDTEMAQQLAISEQNWTILKNQIHQTLLEHRSKRTPPAIDDKVITAWNGLFISALVESYKSFDRGEYLYEAMSLAEKIVEYASEDFKLFRCSVAETNNISGFLDDYAFLIRAFIDLYQVTFEGYYLEQANNWILYVDTHFFDQNTGFYWFTDKSLPQPFARKQEIYDTVIPSSNAQMAHNLLDMAAFMGNSTFAVRAKEMLRKIIPKAALYPPMFSHWENLLLRYLYPNLQVNIIGKDALSQIKLVWNKFTVNTLYSGSYQKSFYPMLRDKFVQGKTLIYVCRDNSCFEPEESAESVIQLVQENLQLFMT